MSCVVAPQCRYPRLAGGVGKLFDDRKDRIAHDFYFASQTLFVERIGLGHLGDVVSRIGRNDAEPGLRPRKCHLRLDAASQESTCAEDLAHPRVGQARAEEWGIDQRKIFHCASPGRAARTGA
jgi:hypothetical protein